MTAKHTPGPWVAVGAWVERPYEDCPDICSCDPESIGQRGRTYDEQCANARLIAAAPELLYALKAMLEIAPELPPAACHCHISPPCNDCVSYAGEREIYEQAASAIAKAEGRA